MSTGWTCVESPQQGLQLRPLVWTHRVGAGLSFVNSLGHPPESYDDSNTPFVSMIESGIKFVTKTLAGASEQSNLNTQPQSSQQPASSLAAPQVSHGTSSNGTIPKTTSSDLAQGVNVSATTVGGMLAFVAVALAVAFLGI
jgi:hypothetical protein